MLNLYITLSLSLPSISHIKYLNMYTKLFLLHVFQKRLLDKQQDTATKKAKLSTSIAYKHSSVVPRDADVQNFRIFVGKAQCLSYMYMYMYVHVYCAC